MEVLGMREAGSKPLSIFDQIPGLRRPELLYCRMRATEAGPLRSSPVLGEGLGPSVANQEISVSTTEAALSKHLGLGDLKKL